MFDTHSKRYYLTWIVLIAMIIKLIVFLILMRLGADFTLSDSASYINPANEIFYKGNFLYNHDLWMRTPLYPLIIAGFYGLFGQNLYAIIIFQIVCSALLVVNAYRITALFSDVKVGLWAAVLVALDYLYISYANLVLTDLIAAVLLSFIFYYALSFLKNNKNYKSLIIVGIILALSTLLRPITYYLTPLLALFLFFYLLKKEHSIKALSWMLLFILPSVLLVGSWQLRNKHAIGTYQYTNIDAVNLYHYYAADIIAHQQGISVAAAQDQLDREANLLFPDNGIELYDYYRSRGMEILVHNIKWSVVQFTSGFIRTLFGNDYILLFYNNESFLHGKTLENDLFNRHYAHFFETMSVTDYIKFSMMVLFFVFNFTLVISSSYFIINRLKSNSHNKAAVWVLLLFMGYFLLVSSNYCSQARFRLPFEIILNCFSVLGCYQFFMLCHKKSSHLNTKVYSQNALP